MSKQGTYRPTNFTLVAGILILCCLSTFVRAQQLKGKVTDTETKQPLQFCSIGVVGKNIGTVSSKSGAFSLDISSVVDTDTIVLSYLGYERISFVRKSKKYSDSIYFNMKSIPTMLKEVVVTQSPALVEIGMKKKTDFKGFNGWGGPEHAGKGNQVGLVVPITKEVLISEVGLRIESNTFDSVLLRLNLYSVSKDGYPNAPLLDKNIYLTVKQRKGWANFDIRKDLVVIKEDFCASVEWIEAWGSKGKGDMLTFSRGDNKPGVSLYLGGPNAKWTKQVGSRAPSIGFMVEEIDSLQSVARNSNYRSKSADSAKATLVRKNPDVVIQPMPADFKLQGGTKKIGLQKPTKSTSGMSGSNLSSPAEFGALITGIDKPGLLSEFDYHLKYNTFDSVLLELTIYHLEDGKPSEAIAKGIQFSVGKKTGWQKVNLEKYKILVDKDVVATLKIVDALSLNHKPKDFYFSRAAGKGFNRDDEYSPWAPSQTMGTAFYLTLKQ